MTTQSRPSEVRIKRDNVDTAFGAPELDGDLGINLDADDPYVLLPTDVDARYRDVDEEETAADGGHSVDRHRITTSGFAFTSEQGGWAAAAGGFAVLLAGYLVSAGPGDGILAPLVALIAGALLLYLGTGAYWRGLEN